MAINFPSSLDNGTSLPYPSATDDTNSPSLSGLQDNQNDALIALETKLGIADANSQTPVTGNLLASTATGESSWSVPYPASTIVGISDTQTLTNKTIDVANNTITNLAGADIASQSITATQIANATITATQIANNTITNTQIASGGIDYANLLSTIFSGQLTPYANSGSAGGNFQYINLGGLKLLFGSSSEFNVNTVPGAYSYGITYPSGFFTTAPTPFAYLLNYTNTQAYINTSTLNSATGDTVTVTPMAGNSPYFSFWYMAIGT